MYDLTKENLVREGVTLGHLYTMITDQDLEEIGIPEMPRRLIRAALQVPSSTMTCINFRNDSLRCSGRQQHRVFRKTRGHCNDTTDREDR